MPIYVGTSGYYYKEWVGPVYPEGTDTRSMLELYSRMFDALEINATYYRPPSPDMFKSYPDRTGGHLKIVVKLHSSFTHERNAEKGEAVLFDEAVKPIVESDQFVAFLAQFPQSFHSTAEAREYVEKLRVMFPNAPLVFEFRHKSWWSQDVLEYLSELGVAMATVDLPDLPGLPPTGATFTSEPGYVRLHGRNAEGWFAGRNERYTYKYEKNELENILKKVQKIKLKSGVVVVAFNNHPFGYSAINATEFVKILREAIPDDLPPPREERPEDTDQISLF